MKYWINFDKLSPNELPLPEEVQLNESGRIVIGVFYSFQTWFTMNRVEYSLFYYFVQRCIEDPFAVLDELINYFAGIPPEGIDQNVCEIPREYRGGKVDEECVGCVFAHISANVIGFDDGHSRGGVSILPALFNEFAQDWDDIFEIFKHTGIEEEPWGVEKWAWHPVDVFREIKSELLYRSEVNG